MLYRAHASQGCLQKGIFNQAVALMPRAVCANATGGLRIVH